MVRLGVANICLDVLLPVQRAQVPLSFKKSLICDGIAARGQTETVELTVKVGSFKKKNHSLELLVRMRCRVCVFRN